MGCLVFDSSFELLFVQIEFVVKIIRVFPSSIGHTIS